MQVLDEKLVSEGKKFELSKKEVSDIPEANSSCDLDSIKSEQIHDHSECRKEIQLEKPDVNKESSTQKIGQDLWRQPKRVSIPVFNGDKRSYENWKSVFIACVDQVPATPEYKLLQLSQYLSGEALKAIENLGHSGFAYESAKERLEQKYGGQKRKVMLHIDELENFKPIRVDHPKDQEKFANLLNIAVINLKEENRIEELGNSTFYRKLLKKMPERMITQYQRWVFDKEKKENVENLRSFVIQEAEFQMGAAKTIGNKAKIDHTYFGLSQQSNKVKYHKKCVFCKLDHSLWDCVQFKQLDIRQR